MNRRTFLSVGGMATLLPAHIGSLETEVSKIRPKALQKGDTVGLISPGFSVEEASVEYAVNHFTNWGFIPKLGNNVGKTYGYLAGTDEERASDLMAMFLDPEVKAIWCLRGGYGCTRILPLLDFDKIRANPKLIIGYSDITALHLAIHERAKLVTFHGPIAASVPSEYTRLNVESLIYPGIFPKTIYSSEVNEKQGATSNIFKYYPIREGKATGELVGGNLSLIAALTGTGFLPSFKGKLVFLEDVGEKPYEIDRMLVQLFQGTDLAEAAGIILGVFEDCERETGDDKGFTIHDLFKTFFEPLKIPVAYGFSFGHIKDQCTLPVGVLAEMDTRQKTIRIMESPIS